MIHVVLLGDDKAGKTSVFNRITSDSYTFSYIKTVKHQYKKYKEKFNIYDTCADERFHYLTIPYVEIADAAIIVCDVLKDEKKTVDKWKKFIKTYNGRDIPILIVKNKCDLVEKKFKDTVHVLHISCKNNTSVKKIDMFFNKLMPNPKISIHFYQYILLLAKDASNQTQCCLQ